MKQTESGEGCLKSLCCNPKGSKCSPETCPACCMRLQEVFLYVFVSCGSPTVLVMVLLGTW